MLWTCLHFPDLPLQLFCASPVSKPLAVTNGAARPVVLARNREAAAAGVVCGMAVSAAQALCANLRIKARDDRAEAAALAGIAAWAGQFTPTVSLDAQCLLLEIGGCLTLFGSLEKLLRKIREGVTELGYEVVMATAATPIAAAMLARSGTGLAVAGNHELTDALAPLPLAWLGCSSDVIANLDLAGIHSIGECLALPRAAMARRYSQGVLDQIDRALGRLADPRPLFIPPSKFAMTLPLSAPVEEAESLLFGVKRLITNLVGYLRARNAGVCKFRLSLGHRKIDASEIVFKLSIPNRDADHLFALLRERLHQTSLAAPVEFITLAADEVAALAPATLALFSDPAEEACMSDLLDRLSAQLGDSSLNRIRLFHDHRPELAWRTSDGNVATALPANPRPLWLLEEPKRLATDGSMPPPALEILSGPERIEGGWWDGRDVARDYFVARGLDGSRVWVFIDNARREWFLHGIFS